MVRKVKTYLNNADTIEDEDRLVEMANQCEPSRTFEIGFDFAFISLLSSYDNQTSSIAVNFEFIFELVD